MIVGLLNVAALVTGQSGAPQQQPVVSSSAAIGNSPTTAPPSLASPTPSPSVIEPTQSPSSLPQGPPILCSDQTVYVLSRSSQSIESLPHAKPLLKSYPHRFELCLKNQENYIKACRNDGNP
jgi:hypothetical protein